MLEPAAKSGPTLGLKADEPPEWAASFVYQDVTLESIE
jgi:hypothetical protein